MSATDLLDHCSAAQRQRLVDEGMLLTPEQVMALENFDFDLVLCFINNTSLRVFRV